MFIISEDSTEAWTRYLLAASCGWSILKFLDAPVIAPPQDRLPFTSIVQLLNFDRVAKTSAPVVLEKLIASRVGRVVSSPLFELASTAIPSSVVPITPMPIPFEPESPQMPARELPCPFMLLVPDVPLTPTPESLAVLAFTPNVMSLLLESFCAAVMAVAPFPVSELFVTTAPVAETTNTL